MAPQQFPCVNSAPEGPGCQKNARFTCKNCRLVAYCGPQCQKTHRKQHKKDCKSDLGQKIWFPEWVAENRKATFDSAQLGVPLRWRRCLWGSLPAIDVLKLGNHEGSYYTKSINILFAASGDLRNVIKAVTQLPESYKQPVAITINDNDPAVVARNLITLVIAMTAKDADEAADAIIHTWYSALLRKSDLDILQSTIRLLVAAAHEQTAGMAPTALLGQNWTFGERSVKLVLRKSTWGGLLSFLEVPEGLTAERADEIRRAVTLAEGRRDHRDRLGLFQSPSGRVARNRFQDDGCLLPFGFSQDEFQHPNPTIFQDNETWPMPDIADPLHGWDAKEVEDTPSGPAGADIYGNLYYYLRREVKSFIRRISGGHICFTLFQMDAADLPRVLRKSTFSRIEVSNISDNSQLGIFRTLDCMTPLLQEPQVNPHATLITLSVDVVEETMVN